MRVVAYLRVSTDRQGERGLGLDVQDSAVRTYCRQHGHRVVAVCRDEGVSGSNGLQDRLGLAEALRLLRRDKPTGRRQADGMVVYRLDRLARDLIVQEHLLAEVWQADAEVLSTASGEAGLRDDPAGPTICTQAARRASDVSRAMWLASVSESRVVITCRNWLVVSQPCRWPNPDREDAATMLPSTFAAAVTRVSTESHSRRSVPYRTGPHNPET
ncbi:MAG: recombinase family protein [Actinomycetota bacterium]|nr:recombinase family protein [Actinomycetota bacterium]